MNSRGRFPEAHLPQELEHGRIASPAPPGEPVVRPTTRIGSLHDVAVSGQEASQQCLSLLSPMRGMCIRPFAAHDIRL